MPHWPLASSRHATQASAPPTRQLSVRLTAAVFSTHIEVVVRGHLFVTQLHTHRGFGCAHHMSIRQQSSTRIHSDGILVDTGRVNTGDQCVMEENNGDALTQRHRLHCPQALLEVLQAGGRHSVRDDQENALGLQHAVYLGQVLGHFAQIALVAQEGVQQGCGDNWDSVGAVVNKGNAQYLYRRRSRSSPRGCSPCASRPWP